MNKNSTRIAKLNAKSAKTGKAVDSSFGSSANKNRTRKSYGKSKNPSRSSD